MRKWSLVLSVVVLLGSWFAFFSPLKVSAEASKSVVKTTESSVAPKILAHHVYRQGETLWFISLVYYGTGSQFQKIVEANNLPSTEGLKPGQVLQIPESQWDPESPAFQQRYKEVWAKHQARVQQAHSTSHNEAQNLAQNVVVHASESEAAKPEPVVVELKEIKEVKEVKDPLAAAPKSKEDSTVLVVPLPTSPIFQADPAAAKHRSAQENSGE